MPTGTATMTEGEASVQGLRHQSTLAAPGTEEDLIGFPAVLRPVPGEILFRVHHRSRGVWWFASPREEGGGRFDLRRPCGTLNVAACAETAARESLGRLLVGAGVVPQSAVEDRTVSALVVPQLRLADLTAGSAAQFGLVPGDVSAPQEFGYGLTQQWAEAMADAGFRGILARSRFGAGQNPQCIFVFGAAGEHKPEGCSVAEERPLQEVVEELGYAVVSTPSSQELQIEE